MELIEILEAKYHGSSYIAWINQAKERVLGMKPGEKSDEYDNFKKPREICSGQEGIKWKLSEWDQAEKDLIDSLGPSDDEEYDEHGDYKSLYWRMKTGITDDNIDKQMWYISLFTYGRLEEPRRLGICVAIGR